jgi:hypothetical protein
VHLRKWVSTVNNHQSRLTYHLRAIIVLMWANDHPHHNNVVGHFKAH